MRSSFSSLFPASSPATADELNGSEYSVWIDVNGDGLKDYLHLNIGGSLSLRLNTGHGLGSRIPIAYSNRVLDCNSETDTTCGTTWTTDYERYFGVSDVDGNGRESFMIPQRISAAMCEHFVTKVGGELEGSYGCPPDPLTGQLSTTWFSNVAAIDPVFDLYAKG